ncbi:predicted DNA methylase containing a Zn-ribbon module [Desulfurococcus amylolyticus 1221n]|uniref:Predicted DNA methylase containing a Zn-ribbon module n=1 Tax=Desulfurococcus amylolyticus (strain DSM 18924 / JCM 16383 / VKM B-2413 / 1221n) TaxID=490899 RepID=B8D457_DESA1|nr:predicted DNA methylase containing a Zn-ribbon module [Desulfurococcus amylolyticus 1221n]
MSGAAFFKTLAEATIPLGDLNSVAEKEAGFIRVPKLSNLHPYLARRPTSTARVFTLAAVLPENADPGDFTRAVGLDKVNQVPYGVLYLVNPDRKYIAALVKKYRGKEPKDVIVVDPMAGGGSIPLESLRLGFYTIAVDYNPVAYLLLKATLEYPARYGRRLHEDVKREVEELLNWARRELSQYYPPDAYNYIIARGYRCPNPKCGGLIPIIHSTKLGKKGPYIGFKINKDDKTFAVEITDSETIFEKFRCPYCGTPINDEVALKKWVQKHKELLETALSGDVDKAKEKIRELLETHILLVKETPEGFKPAGEEDKEALVKAYLDLAKQINDLRDVLPDAQIPSENDVFKPIRDLGIEYWYELFNPRQLLILLKLLKYVKERTEQLIKERGEYGAAIAIYIAFGIDKFADYNNIATEWHTTRFVVDRLLGRYQERGRTVDLGLEYCEMLPIVTDPGKSLGWVYEPHVKSVGGTAGGVLPVLRLLSEWLEGLGDRVEVYCGDARRLSEILGGRRVDIVNVDPPYLAQHSYSDLMEFFWQFLRIMFQPAIDGGYLFNRDPSRGRVELFIEGWSPYLPVLPREAEIIARRGRDKIGDLSNKSVELIERQSFTGAWYVLRMWEFFRRVSEVLRDDGLLIVWFTHSDPDAWEAIMSSLYAAGFTLSKAWPTWTEMAQRRAALLTSAFFTSLILVLRKRGVVEELVTGANNPSMIVQDEALKKAIASAVLDSLASAYNSKVSGPEIFIMGLAGGIAGATRIWNPDIDKLEIPTQKSLLEHFGAVEGVLDKSRFKKALTFYEKVLYPAAVYLTSTILLEDSLKRAKLDERAVSEVLSTDSYTRAYLVLWTATRYAGSRELVYDFVEKICKILNVPHQALVNFGLLRKSARSSSNTYEVLFGSECYSAVGHRIELLTKTSAGRAIHLLRLIGGQPREDVSRAAKGVISSMPVSRGVAATALFLLHTARSSELELVGLSELTREFADKVLVTIYRGV